MDIPSLLPIGFLCAAMAFSTNALAAKLTEQEQQALVERIKPIGSVYLSGQQVVASKPSGPRDGAAVYGTYCMACHASGVGGAPKTGNEADWASRIAQGHEVLEKHAIEGFNMMPPKGTCMDCSDKEIAAAINHMIEGL